MQCSLSLSLSLSLCSYPHFIVALFLFPFCCTSRTGHRGKVQNPGALQFERVVLSKVNSNLNMLCFDRNDNMVLPLHIENEVHVRDQSGMLFRMVASRGKHNRP